MKRLHQVAFSLLLVSAAGVASAQDDRPLPNLAEALDVERAGQIAHVGNGYYAPNDGYYDEGYYDDGYYGGYGLSIGIGYPYYGYAYSSCGYPYDWYGWYGAYGCGYGAYAYSYPLYAYSWWPYYSFGWYGWYGHCPHPGPLHRGPAPPPLCHPPVRFHAPPPFTASSPPAWNSSLTVRC